MSDCPTCGRPMLPEWNLDEGGRIVIDGQPIDFTPREAALLGMLLRAKGRVVLKDALIQGTWPDGEPEMAEKALDVHVHNIRQKLAGTGLRVETRYGYGFGAVRERQP